MAPTCKKCGRGRSAMLLRYREAKVNGIFTTRKHWVCRYCGHKVLDEDKNKVLAKHREVG